MATQDISKPSRDRQGAVTSRFASRPRHAPSQSRLSFSTAPELTPVLCELRIGYSSFDPLRGRRNRMKRNLYVGALLVALIALLGAGSFLLEKRSVAEAATTMAPRFEVDPLWPKPLPNHWIM